MLNRGTATASTLREKGRGESMLQETGVEAFYKAKQPLILSPQPYCTMREAESAWNHQPQRHPRESRKEKEKSIDSSSSATRNYKEK